MENLVTPDLWRQISATIGRSAGNTTLTVTTAAISTELSSWQDAAATVTIAAIRTENNSGQIQTLQKNYAVDLQKVGNDWLVNKFTVVQ